MCLFLSYSLIYSAAASYAGEIVFPAADIAGLLDAFDLKQNEKTMLIEMAKRVYAQDYSGTPGDNLLKLINRVMAPDFDLAKAKPKENALRLIVEGYLAQNAGIESDDSDTEGAGEGVDLALLPALVKAVVSSTALAPVVSIAGQREEKSLDRGDNRNLVELERALLLMEDVDFTYRDMLTMDFKTKQEIYDGYFDANEITSKGLK